MHVRQFCTLLIAISQHRYAVCNLYITWYSFSNLTPRCVISLTADAAEIWNLTEVVAKIQKGRKSDWRIAFKEGIQIDKKVLQETFNTQPAEDDLYAARYDLSFLTPRGRSIRCKVGYVT